LTFDVLDEALASSKGIPDVSEVPSSYDDFGALTSFSSGVHPEVRRDLACFSGEHEDPPSETTQAQTSIRGVATPFCRSPQKPEIVFSG